MHWKLIGIPNPICDEGQTRTPEMGIKSKLKMKRRNKFQTDLLPNIKLAAYDKVIA
jgi:hypothetical protein